MLWLNERDIDVRCVRMRPYTDGERVLIDVQQVIPLPEAGQYVVQVREKERRERRSRESGRDYTRYDITIDGKLHSGVNKRNTMLLVVRALCAKGALPDEISEVIYWKGNPWRSTPGEIGADDFAAQMELQAQESGPAWTPRRWHSDEEGLIHTGGSTWAFTNQWGNRTGEALELLLARWPECGISVSESAG